MFTPRSRTETEYYMFQGLNKWLQIHHVSRFVLCAQSLGGYMATKYALVYPERLFSLTLISPAGVWEQPKGFDPMMTRWREARGYLGTKVYALILSHWKRGKSPFELCRILGRLSQLFLKAYMDMYPRLKPEVRLLSSNRLRNVPT